MRRMFAAIAAMLLTLTLAACGEDPPAPPSTTPLDEDLVAEPFIRDAPLPPPDEAETAQPAGEESEPPVGTVIEDLWISEHWEIEELSGDTDPCAYSIHESAFSRSSELFSCGPPALGARACTLGSGEGVICISDALSRRAVVFDSPVAADPTTEPSRRERLPIPLHVELEDGVRCHPLDHDHKQHFGGFSSWFDCDDGSELLTVETIDGTFLRGKTWYGFRSVDKSAPVRTALAAVTFAGR